MTAVLMIVGFVAGLTCGIVFACAQLPRMIAKMTEAQLDALAARVERLRNGAR